MPKIPNGRSSLLGLVVALALSPALIFLGTFPSAGQRDSQRVRTVSIPVSIYTKQELRQGQIDEILKADRLTVRENREEQTILSIRSISDAPLSLAIVIQDGLTPSANLQLGELRKFIRELPDGTRVMIAYLRANSPEIRQKFTTDRERASRMLRIVSSSPSAAPSNPYDGLVDIYKRFDALPAGRRAVLLVADGLDMSNGLRDASATQSIYLDRAIADAQRRNIAIFSFYNPTLITEAAGSTASLVGQGSLLRLSDETGGRAFFQGMAAPISFEPFFKELRVLLTRQFLLSYLSTNMKKGYYKVEVTSSNPEVKIEHPRGYYYR
ncbi:hypothetical protein [Leptolyngbya sp. 7M]|uniref:hypothetical protein n=1 Tax=Leptolyngbya sp. 7M TaxID=2812896 RepID=UPI001B8AA292|nr:hypothetical protein [Leptolyngbya sp. 7M]QYO65540.1 hypothetical protein JVX88_01765 [Leptolyngbya sp. 7M]